MCRNVGYPNVQNREAYGGLVLFLVPLKGNVREFKETRDEEAMLDEAHALLPVFWAHWADMLASKDVMIRSTYAAKIILTLLQVKRRRI